MIVSDSQTCVRIVIAVKPPRLDVMFSYYDTDGDDSVSANELETAGRRVALRQLSRQCRVPDLMTFEDTVVDKRLSRSEFYAAFSKCRTRRSKYGLPAGPRLPDSRSDWQLRKDASPHD